MSEIGIETEREKKIGIERERKRQRERERERKKDDMYKRSEGKVISVYRGIKSVSLMKFIYVCIDFNFLHLFTYFYDIN